MTPNDRIDLDDGPNNLLNFPTIHLISRHKLFGKSTKTEVSGSLTNIPNTLYQVDFYATKTDEAERIEHGIQGQRHLGEILVEVGTEGFVHFQTDELPGTDDDEVITATVTDPFNNTSEFSHFTPDFTVDRGSTSVDIRTPVLVVPGFFGSLPDALPGSGKPLGTYANFLRNHGIHPSELAMEPVTRGYDDLLASLKKAGYEEGKDLWAAPYDWRLPLAPSSVPGSSLDKEVDGLIDGVAATAGESGVNITDESFLYGIDYLGYWLRQVAEQWFITHGQPLPSVHIISHSMGGVLSRSYIQSLAYGETFQTSVTPGESVDLALPMVESFTMFGVPNQGSPVVFPAWYDDFSSSSAYVFVLSKVILHGWLKLQTGSQLNIVDQGVYRSLSLSEFSGMSTIEQKQKFARLYVPGMRDLQPSYPGVFTNFFRPDDDAGSKLLEDLNVMNDGVTRLGARVGHTLALYGTDLSTSFLLEERVGPETYRYYPPVLFLEYVEAPRLSINPFDSLLGRIPEEDEIWYEDFIRAAHGDGTVPIESLQGLFVDDESTKRVLYCNANCEGAFNEGQTDLTPSAEDVSHTGLPYNRDAQLRVLQNLHHPLPHSTISNDLHLDSLLDTLRTLGGFNDKDQKGKIILNDPVNAILIDAEGRRLGYTEETGPLSEIPRSVYLGDADGIGWIFASAEESRPPYTLRILGQDEDYVVQVTSIAGNAVDGVLQQGHLATGESIGIPVPEVESTFTVDIDADGYTDALTDGLLLKRYMEGLRGESLVAGAVNREGKHQSSVEIENYLAAAGLETFEIDNNNNTLSSTDGELIQRGMLGFHDATLIDGALGADAARNDANAILDYLYASLVTGSRLNMRPGDQKQSLASDFDGRPVTPGEASTLQITYSAEAGDTVAAGLAFRLHFDSRQIELSAPEMLVADGLQQVFDDSLDFDNDPRTDNYLQFFWSETSGPWLESATELTDLFKADYTLSERSAGTAIKFTAASLSPGFTLDAPPIEIPSSSPQGFDWQNALEHLDVNYDSFVSPVDALQVINDLNRSGSRPLASRSLSNAVPPYVDTSGDDFVAPIDVLLIVNFLNRNGLGEVASLEPMVNAKPNSAFAIPADYFTQQQTSPRDNLSSVDKPPVARAKSFATDAHELGPATAMIARQSDFPATLQLDDIIREELLANLDELLATIADDIVAASMRD